MRSKTTNTSESTNSDPKLQIHSNLRKNIFVDSGKFAASDRMKGFTLIEMVIVVGVIGILTSMVLVGLGRARDYAKDARITSNLNQLKVVAEMRYAVDGNYGNVSAGSPGTGCSYSGGNSDIMKLATDICNYGGILTITRQTTAPVNSKYCAYSVLNIKTAGGATQYFCVDSTGDAATLSEHSSCANSADPKCR